MDLSLMRKAAGAVLAAVLLTGCGDSGLDAEDAPPPNAALDKQMLKERLESIANSGQTGSALAGMRESIEATGDKSLLSDFERLQKSRGAQAKQIAQQMAAKL